jgi:hypothetical protein
VELTVRSDICHEGNMQSEFYINFVKGGEYTTDNLDYSDVAM